LSKQFSALTGAHRSFIAKQKVFFVASAAAGSRVNVSPKGLDCLRVLDDSTAVYLDRTGSTNETAAHLLADGRLTIMFCGFEGPPSILRLYGRGDVLSRSSQGYAQLLHRAFAGFEPVGARQMVRLSIELVQTSCGYGVPHMAYQGDRPSLDRWAADKGEAGLAAYRLDHNLRSLDGLPTLPEAASADCDKRV
jgi:hypothetical protein